MVRINDGYSNVERSDQPWSTGISLGEIDVLGYAETAEVCPVIAS
jgi:nuclear pore complex protein Nup98-Nup96